VNLPVEFLGQLFSRPQALAVTGAFLGLLIFTSLPTVPLMLIGGSCASLAVMLTRRDRQEQVEQQAAKKAESDKPVEERIEDFLAVDPMELSIGVGLIRLADPKRGGDLLERIKGVRQLVAQDIGILMPKVRIRDDMRLDQHQYRVKIADMSVADGRLHPELLLAMDSGATTGKVSGIETTEPAFNTPATWIDPTSRGHAELNGYTVVEPVAVLATHLTEVVRQHADEILTRDATKHLIDELKETMPAVVEELIPNQMKLHEVQRVLQLLLREHVPIRQLGPILETLGDWAGRTKDPQMLTEYVRNRLARTICTRYRDKENRLHVVVLDPAIEDRVAAGIEHTDRGMFVRLSPQVIEQLCSAIASETKKLAATGRQPILLVGAQIRAGVKQMTEPHLSRLVVLSYNEVTRDTKIESVGMVSEAAGA